MSDEVKVPFEVGKFYRVQIVPCYSEVGQKVNARCAKVCSRKVVFEYIVRGIDGVRKIRSVDRRTDVLSDGSVEASSRERYSGISPTNSVKDLTEKRPLWDQFLTKKD